MDDEEPAAAPAGAFSVLEEGVEEELEELDVLEVSVNAAELAFLESVQ